MASLQDIPILYDSDTGFGNALNVIRTVHEYEKAGVAGIHIEDQVMLKRCGHLDGKVLIPADEFVSKLKAALKELHQMGYKIVINPSITTFSHMIGMKQALDYLKRNGTDVGAMPADVNGFELYWEVTDCKKWKELEEKYTV